jgi:transcriptional antiterminator NusG
MGEKTEENTGPNQSYKQSKEEDVNKSSSQGQWYVIHTQTGYEARTKKALEQRIKTLSVEKKVFEIVIPTREVIVVRKGKKSKKTENVFPGYLLVRMILDDESWLVVRTTEGVTGFVGAGLKPTPITEKEVEAIMKFIQQEQPKFKTRYSVGEAVKITEGPFADFLGTIDKIDEERGKVRVLVSIFDRETPVELDFFQVQKL